MRESAEMYLETILVLSKKGPVRSIDIANHTGYTRPTISQQMKRLREKGLITMDEDNLIAFTKKGQALAERVYERHQVLTALLLRLGVDEETAVADACRVEHYISQTTFDLLKDLHHRLETSEKPQ